MESQPQNPEFRINPENFHPCDVKQEDKYWALITQNMIFSENQLLAKTHINNAFGQGHFFNMDQKFK